jgi:hypothetical protein
MVNESLWTSPLVRHPAAILAVKVMIQRLREMPDHLRNQGPLNI